MKIERGLSMALVLLALVSCGQGAGQQKVEAPAIPVTVTRAGTADVEIMERSIGRILDPAATLIPAELAARVVWLGVDVGDAVKKGQTLARLDDRDARARVAAARAEMARLDARIPAQKRLVARYRKLAADKFVSPTMLDQAEAELASLRRARDAARAALERARLVLRHTVVHAPMDGVIQKRFVAAGDFVKAGGPLLQLVSAGHGAKHGTLSIAIPFPETRAARIRPGQRVRLRLPAGGATVSATIDELSPMIGADNGAFEARVHLENPGGWRPGGSVVAEVVVAVHRHAVVVPEAALVQRPAGKVVYRIDGTGEMRTAHAVRVKTGEHLDGRIEITRGLRAGTPIAVDGAAFLTDGARVRVKSLPEAGK
ncbi:MAG: efflux RND transporter periplasmic adaptor subunit [Bacteroidetes bacterium]|nr:MAG: efflux RND transporter periplasmic adaptor subunit [Bacteroidota bacterium]